MIKIKYERLLVALMCTLAILIIPIKVAAAGENVVMSVSNSNVSVGETVTYGVWLNQTASVELTIDYDSTYLEYSSSSDESASVETGKITITGTNDRIYLKFKTIKNGSTRVTAKGVNSAGDNIATGAAINISGSASAVQETEKSDDSSLQSLTLDGVVLSPEFSHDITTYSGNVGLDVEGVAVNGFPSDKNATIASIDGNEKLIDGINQINVLVKAENGTTTTYTIELTRGDSQALEAENGVNDVVAQSTMPTFTYGAVTYRVSNNYDVNQLPDGFSTVDMELEGQTVHVYQYADTGIYQIYLENVMDETDGNLFAYDPESQVINFEIGYIQGGQNGNTASAVEALQSKYDQLVSKNQEQQEHSRMTFYIMIVIVAVLVIVFLNVIIFSKKTKKNSLENDQYLEQIARQNAKEGYAMTRKNKMKAEREQNQDGAEDQLKNKIIDSQHSDRKENKALKTEIKCEETPLDNGQQENGINKSANDDFEFIDLDDL